MNGETDLKVASAPRLSVSFSSTRWAALVMGSGYGRMNGMPQNAKVPLLGFADTVEEAQYAESEVFDVWLERSGLVIAPPAGASGAFR